MAKPNPPYSVNFVSDPASSARMDHTQSAPGGKSHRAGNTAISFPGKGALTVSSETGTPRADRSVPFFFRSVQIYFRLTDYLVQITSDYKEGSCAYNATLKHEIDEHIQNPTRIMNSFQDPFIQALNAVWLPTQNVPCWIPPDQAEPKEAEYVHQVQRVILDFRSRILSALKEAKAVSDSKANYQLVYKQCSLDEWKQR